MQTKLRKFAVRAGWVALVLFGLAQLVPYSRDHTSSPVMAEVPWAHPRTRLAAADTQELIRGLIETFGEQRR